MFPVYVRVAYTAGNEYIDAKKLSCLPVRSVTASIPLLVIVFQSVLNGNRIAVDAKSIVPQTLLLSGVSPYPAPSGAPVAHYRPSLHDLAVRFHDPQSRLKTVQSVQATGSYRVPGAHRLACFESKPVPRCAAPARPRKSGPVSR